MKLTIQNLGRIQNAEITLAPLTVFFGKNGTQKTWTAHAYFKLLEQFRLWGVVPDRVHPAPIRDGVNVVVGEWLKRLGEAPASAVTLTVSRSDLLARLPALLSSTIAGREFTPVIGVAQGADTAVTLDIPRAMFMAGVSDRATVTVSADRKRIDRELHVSVGREPIRTTYYAGNEGELGSFLQLLLRELATAWKYQVRALPAERATLGIMFTSLLRDQATMPRALEDFCYMMATAASVNAASPDGDLSAATKRVVEGEFSFQNSELFFQGSDAAAPRLPIKSTASLAKSVAGLSVFLAAASPGDVLIIDEPEMNAHPEAQTALVELFATMIRKGMHVLLLTHSPYIVDHLSTLVEASRLDAAGREVLRDKFALGSAEVFLAPAEVAVYEFLGETVRSVFDRETGVIDWSTFTDVNDHESTLVRAILAGEKVDAA